MYISHVFNDRPWISGRYNKIKIILYMFLFRLRDGQETVKIICIALIYYSTVSYVVAVAAAGVDNGIIPAIASRYLSPRGLSIVALILVPSGYLLTWNAFFWREFHQRHPALLVLYLGMAGTHTVVFFKRLGSRGFRIQRRCIGGLYDT